jgi:sugar/nucleoside kinase (ribokinase family)
MIEVDYLAIGHVSQDRSPTGPRLGGTVTFSSLTARALGARVAIVTSGPPEDSLFAPLRELPLHAIPAPHFTTFENTTTPAGRVQTLFSHAAILHPDSIPPAWHSAHIVHLAPVADEVDPALADFFPNSFLGITPQGWMRRWDESGRVSFQRWQSADRILSRADAVVLSIEDVRGDESLIQQFTALARLMVVTRGPRGCTVYRNGRTINVAAPAVVEVDSTGAGDIFAAAFFLRVHAGADPVDAAQFAARLASDSVARPGLEAIPPVQPLTRP